MYLIVGVPDLQHLYRSGAPVCMVAESWGIVACTEFFFFGEKLYFLLSPHVNHGC